VSLTRLLGAGLAAGILALTACDGRSTEVNEDLKEAAYGDPPSTTSTTEAPPSPTTTLDWWTEEDRAAYEERKAGGPDSALGIISGTPTTIVSGDMCADGTYPGVRCADDWPCELIVSKLETGECWRE